MARRGFYEGSVADVSRRALRDADRALRAAGLGAVVVHSILDEVLFDVPAAELADAARVASQAMRGAFALIVPLVVGVEAGPNWADLEPVEGPVDEWASSLRQHQTHSVDVEQAGGSRRSYDRRATTMDRDSLAAVIERPDDLAAWSVHGDAAAGRAVVAGDRADHAHAAIASALRFVQEVEIDGRTDAVPAGVDGARGARSLPRGRSVAS